MNGPNLRAPLSLVLSIDLKAMLSLQVDMVEQGHLGRYPLPPSRVCFPAAVRSALTLIQPQEDWVCEQSWLQPPTCVSPQASHFGLFILPLDCGVLCRLPAFSFDSLLDGATLVFLGDQNFLLTPPCFCCLLLHEVSVLHLLGKSPVVLTPAQSLLS